MAKSDVEDWLEEMEREAAMPPEPAAAQAAVALVPSSDEGLSELWSPQPGHERRRTVEEVLTAQGKLDAEKLLQARTVQTNSRGKKISQILLETGSVSEEDIQRALAETLGLDFEPINPKKVD